QLLSALGAVHGCGIAHRKVKPTNVFLAHSSASGGTVKLLDFGAATELGRVEPRPDPLERTAAGVVLGMPEYLSPEQVCGSRVFLATVDVYACGVLLYEMIAGRRAFAGPRLATLFDHIRRGLVRPLADLRPEAPPELLDVVARAMSVDPLERFQTAAEMRDA